MRAGAYGLSLLSDSLNISVLDALERGPLPLADLRSAVGAPPPTTLRNRLRLLTEIGVISKEQEKGFPGKVSHDLTSSGRELQEASSVLGRWLAAAPDCPLSLGSPGARSAIKALVGGWSTNMLRALAARPLSLTELDRVITGVNYPALERRLDALRVTRQLAAGPVDGCRSYRTTKWLREAVAPLLATADWERRRTLHAVGLNRLDIETLLLLSVPLLHLSGAPDGTCRLEVRVPDRNGADAAGVVVAVEKGRPRFCRAKQGTSTGSWVSGSTAEWLDALSRRDRPPLAEGGEGKLATILVSALREMLES